MLIIIGKDIGIDTLSVVLMNVLLVLPVKIFSFGGFNMNHNLLSSIDLTDFYAVFAVLLTAIAAIWVVRRVISFFYWRNVDRMTDEEYEDWYENEYDGREW